MIWSRLPRTCWFISTSRGRWAGSGRSSEQRTATGDEWGEFEQHFLLRKVALGDCHRPYGTPCVHEHAPLTELVSGFRQVIGRASEGAANFAA